MLVRVVQKIRSRPPLLIHEVQITRIARGLVKPDPGGRPHEQGVAPRPAVAGVRSLEIKAVCRRMFKNMLKTGFRRLQHRRVSILQKQLQIRLADAVVIGVIGARRELPSEFLSHRHHRVVILRRAGDFVERHDARVQRAVRPGVFLVVIGGRRRMRQLPVGDQLHRAQDGGG